VSALITTSPPYKNAPFFRSVPLPQTKVNVQACYRKPVPVDDFAMSKRNCEITFITG